MQRTSIARHMKLITIVLTAVLAVATFSVLSVVRSRMLAGETSLKKAAVNYSDLRKVYSQASDETDPQPTHVSLQDAVQDGDR
jgi:hypothetical protein